MKTKLLKKVRKRFNIIRYDKVTPKSSDWIRELNRHYSGAPFFVLYDNSNDYFATSFKTFDEAYIDLVRMIVKVYIHTSKNRNEKRTKVWYK